MDTPGCSSATVSKPPPKGRFSNASDSSVTDSWDCSVLSMGATALASTVSMPLPIFIDSLPSDSVPIVTLTSLTVSVSKPVTEMVTV